MVALSSLVDLYQVSNQLDVLYMMRTCNIKYDSVDAGSMARTLRDYSKTNHPDLHKASHAMICTPEETNAIRGMLRKHGMSKVAWVLFKMWVPPHQAETAVMVTFGAVVAGRCMPSPCLLA